MVTRYTVKQLADLVRISVRTLHHYDDIGLLKPAYLGNNGYRYYEQPQLNRLQQVLMYRDFGLSLEQIKDILDTPDYDIANALRGHRQRLAERLRSLNELMRVIEKTLRRIDGDDNMTDTYPNILHSEARTAEYKQWLMDRYSETVDRQIADVRRNITAMAPEERSGLAGQREAWEVDLVAAFKAGMTVETLATSDLLAVHRTLTAAVLGTPCTPETYVSAANVFQGYGEYRDHFEGLAPGLADWLAAGMKAWAALDAAA
jgi:DNA-binding transcriptional MerR regulator